MKQKVLKIWYVVLGLACVVGYFNRDYVLQGNMTSDFSNWIGGFLNTSENMTVKKLDGDCAFVLVSTNGDVYKPKRMLNIFKHEGLNVKVSYDVLDEQNTLCTSGKMIAITKMRKI
ncbi:MAG: hypothetical protein CL843_14700 [Crocinitomicaceae bacterium]|nr:hypothetical protein [Crocinitomicaceae bacterium]|tara:strand:- start:24 stop:371 length:348 start_codon:yes stop_codon:yes gene_type:complete